MRTGNEWLELVHNERQPAERWDGIRVPSTADLTRFSKSRLSRRQSPPDLYPNATRQAVA